MSEETIGEVPEVPKRPRKILIAILLIVIVGVAAAGGFIWWYTQKAPEEEEPSPPPMEYETYSKYGFSIKYPKDMTITEKGVIDATANDDSGVVMGKSFGPYRTFTVVWRARATPLTVGDAENAWEELSNTLGFELTGSIVEATKSGHEMIYQRFTYTEDGQKHYYIFGVWYCNIGKKLYCLSIKQTTEQDVLQVFEEYLDSFVCH